MGSWNVNSLMSCCCEWGCQTAKLLTSLYLLLSAMAYFDTVRINYPAISKVFIGYDDTLTGFFIGLAWVVALSYVIGGALGCVKKCCQKCNQSC